MSPGRVLVGQAQHQRPDRRVDRWSTNSGVGISPMCGDQLPVPAKQGNGRDEEDRPAREQPRRGHNQIIAVSVRLDADNAARQST